MKSKRILKYRQPQTMFTDANQNRADKICNHKLDLLLRIGFQSIIEIYKNTLRKLQLENRGIPKKYYRSQLQNHTLGFCTRSVKVCSR